MERTQTSSIALTFIRPKVSEIFSRDIVSRVKGHVKGQTMRERDWTLLICFSKEKLYLKKFRERIFAINVAKIYVQEIVGIVLESRSIPPA